VLRRNTARYKTCPLAHQVQSADAVICQESR
jgi:hypothetical protein